MTLQAMLLRALKYSLLLTGAVAVIGGGVGFLVVGAPGLVSALIGAAMALVFFGLTAGSLILAGKQDLNVFFAIVMGTWLLKAVIFMALVFLLRGQPFVHPVTLFLTLVVAVIGTLVIDVIVMQRSRLGYVNDSVLPPAGGDKAP